MQALVLTSDTFGITTVSDPVPVAGETCVKVLAAGLNRRDQWIREGKYAKIVYPAILGSDACGLTDKGERVIIDPSFDWGDNAAAQSSGYHILGMPSQGAIAQKVCVPTANLHPAPTHCTDVQAAALPLGGVTAYRALMVRGALQPNETVVITGIGGGVATLAMQMALAAGARVFVTSGSDTKIERAKQLGAAGGVNYHDDAWPKKLEAMAGAADLAIDSAGGRVLNDLTAVVRPGGRIVFFGATTGPTPLLNLHRIFWKQLDIRGSTMGSADDFRAMLAFVNKHRIIPVIDSEIPFHDAVRAFDLIATSDQFGKIVITMS
ncbi:MAG: zinc-binding dehydrogenase [Candidatus Kapabacteria bacterium]|nr:zinc-binding dehydrogenase [Candidatus Kapabacteria bacterium]